MPPRCVRPPSPTSRPSTASRRSGARSGRPSRHLRVRPHRDPRPGLLDRHPAADGVRLAARGSRVLLHPHRPASPATSGCAARRCSTRWAGTTTACRPSAGCRTSSACAATRRCPTTPTSRRPAKPDAKRQLPISRRNFIELCERADRRGREGVRGSCGATSACRSTGRTLYTHDQRRRPHRAAARLPAQPRPRRGVLGRGAEPVGRRRSRPPSPRPSSRPATTPATTTGSRSTARTATRCSSRPPGPS